MLVNTLPVNTKVGQVGLFCKNIKHFQCNCLSLWSARAGRAIPSTFQCILLLIKVEQSSWGSKWWLDSYGACQIKIACFKIKTWKKKKKRTKFWVPVDNVFLSHHAIIEGPEEKKSDIRNHSLSAVTLLLIDPISYIDRHGLWMHQKSKSTH